MSRNGTAPLIAASFGKKNHVIQIWYVFFAYFYKKIEKIKKLLFFAKNGLTEVKPSCFLFALQISP